MQQYRIRSAAGWTMMVFGILAFLLGLLGLIRPEIVLSMLGFSVIDRAARAAGDYTLVFMTAASMASFNMGVYYMVGAFTDWKAFFLWTVPFRLVTFTVFTATALSGIAPMRFILVGAWEGLGAVVTGLALYYDRQHERSSAASKKPGK